MTSTAAKTEIASTMFRSALAWPRPPLAYASLISLSSFGAGVLAEGADSLEDLLVHDEDEPENEERENRRDRQVHQPVPPFALASGDPALHRREPEGEQEETAHRILVEALMEDGITVASEAGAVAPVLEPEAFEQHQVGGKQSPDDIDEPVQLLPVLAELALGPLIARDQERDDQQDNSEA